MTINVTALQQQLEAQKRTINALQNENRWLNDVIFNPSFNEIDMRLFVKNTPREMRMGLCTEFPEKKIYLPDQAEAAHCSPKVASQHLRLIAKKTGAFSYRPERDEETGNTRVILQPLPPAETPAQLAYERAKRGGSAWEDGKRVKRCKDCGSPNLARVSQIICVDCGSAQTEKTYKPVNDTDCHIDTDPDEQEEMDTDCHIDTDPPEDEISNLPPTRVNTQGYVEELKSLPVWCCHRAKVPYNVSKLVRDFQKAKSDDPRTWTTYDQALLIYQESQGWANPFDGIGVMNNGQYTFIDLDHCRDTETGELSDLAYDTIALLGSYTELSQSGTGIHIIARGSIPKAIKRPEIELYNHHRFFVWTGNHLAGTPEEIQDCQAELNSLYKELAPPERKPVESFDRFSSSGSDEEILKKGKNDIKFMYLFRGQCVGSYYQKKDGTPDYSRADLALCKKISYWGAGGDVSTIDRIYRQSGLMRDKWERDDYREQTISKAIGQNWQVAS